MDVGQVEIAANVKQRQSAMLCNGVSHAISKIQLSWMAASLAVDRGSVGGDRTMFRSKRNQRYRSVFSKAIDPSSAVLSEVLEQREFQVARCRNERCLAFGKTLLVLLEAGFTEENVSQR